LTGAGFCTYQRSSAVGPGLPDFFGTTYQNWKDAPKGSQNIPTGNKMFIRNGSKIDKMAPKNYQHLSLQDTPNFTQIGILGLKIYHLATLVGSSWI
jgi:hypothetical protein